ncbi:MAG: hypothetical protein JWN30_2014 [Bacilli bacterium]|nr:hypothetical protein [Bacilli bacterium]
MDNQSMTESAMRQVEAAADEAVQAAMVKTALRANVAGEGAKQTAPLGDVGDELASRESAVDAASGEFKCGAD